MHTYIQTYIHIWASARQPASPPASQTASQAHDRLVVHIHARPLWASLGVSGPLCSVTDFCERSGTARGDPFVPFHFIASFLWAPPVATQFSVVWAPPVATLHSHFISSQHFCGHRLWQLSFLFGHSAYICTYIHTYAHTYIHTHIHAYIHTYTHIHTYIHTHIHTYIHT